MTIKLEFAGRKFDVPRFPIKMQRKFTPLLMRMSRFNFNQLSEDEFSTIIDGLRDVFVENKLVASPDEFEDLAPHIDDISAAFRAFIEASGLKPKAAKPEGTAAAGEDPSNGPANDGTATST